MSRIKGDFNVSNNYEVKRGAPLDARMLVKTRADLIDSSSWSVTGIYDGMIVAVAKDPVEDNNGIYFLTKAAKINQLDAWLKIGGMSDLTSLKARIEALETSTSGIETELKKKQSKLTAGVGITIDSNNVISATGGSTGGGGDLSSMTVETKDNLPATGSEKVIYYTRTPSETYRWDSILNQYVCSGNDYNEIKVIDGGTPFDE